MGCRAGLETTAATPQFTVLGGPWLVRPTQETPVSDKVIHASDADFDTTVLQSSEPVLVDFWAPWCAPCKMIGPVVDQLADEYDGRAKMVKVDVQAFPNLGIRFNVRSIPMLLLFKDGQVQASQMGAPGNIKTVLNQMIEKAL
jgi:thioredoxin 1